MIRALFAAAFLAFAGIAPADANLVQIAPAAGGGNPTIAQYVQNNFASGCASGCSLTISSTTAGQKIIVRFVNFSGSTFPTITDSASDTFTGQTSTASALATSTAIWTATASAGVTTVTATGGASYAILSVTVTSGSGFEAAASNTGSGSCTPTTGTTTQAKDLILATGYASGGSGNVTFTNSFTLESSAGSSNDDDGYLNASATGTFSTTITPSGGSPGTAGCSIIAVKP